MLTMREAELRNQKPCVNYSNLLITISAHQDIHLPNLTAQKRYFRVLGAYVATGARRNPNGWYAIEHSITARQRKLMRYIRALQITARSSSSIRPSRWNIWNPRIASSFVEMPPFIAHAIRELLRHPKRFLAKRLSKVFHVWAYACGSSPSRCRSTCIIYSSTVSLHPSLHALQAGLFLLSSRTCFQNLPC